MIRDPWVRTLAIILSAIASIYLVGLVWQIAQQFADIILLFFLAWLFAFVLEPVVRIMVEGARAPRLAAIALTYSTLLVVVAIGVILLVPALTVQVVEVVRALPTYADQATSWLSEVQLSINQWLLERNSPVKLDIRSALNAEELSRRVEALGPPLLANVLQFAAGAATLLVQLLIVAVLSFYFMVDGHRIGENLIRTLPIRAQDDTRFLFANIHRAFAGFLRSQLIQALFSGIATGLLMAALKIEYALLASVVAGVFLLIPFLGPVVAVWVPVLIALFTKPDAALFLFIALLALQQVIFHVIAPRIMHQEIGLHPLLVFFAVLTGARVAGIWGAIFGVPVVAVLATMASFYRASQHERLARLQQQLPGHELVSVGPPSPPSPTPVPTQTHNSR
jgi:predicted PurR-regulated permease PerM